MKKLIIMAFITIGLAVNVNAQSTPVSTISREDIEKNNTTDISELVGCMPEKTVVIRGHAGAGVSGITSNGFGFNGKYDMMESSPRFSFSFGADVQLPLFDCENFGIRTGLSLQSQGANFLGEDYYQEEFTVKLIYLKAPAVVEYDFNDKFNIYGGIKLGYLLSGKEEYGDSSNEYDIKENLKSIDFGGTLGAHYNIYCNEKISLGAGINYDFGLTDINDSDYDDQEKYKNSALHGLISMSF